MRILYVHPNLIYSNTYFSGTRRLYHLMRFMMAGGHDVSLACFVHKAEESFLKEAEDLKRACKRMEIIQYPQRNIAQRALHFAFSRDPNSVLHNYSTHMRDSINSIVNDGVDIIQFEFTYMGQYVRYLPKGSFATVLDADELNFYAFQVCLRNKLMRLDQYIKYMKLRRYELNICNNFDKILTITKREADILSAALEEKSISVYSNSVDTDYFQPKGEGEEPATIMFLGNFRHRPNVDGVLWFYNAIFPIIQMEVPDAKLLVIGAHPTEDILALSRDEHVEVTGSVTDIRPYMARGTVFTCPVRLGSGMRGKVLEALSMEKVCVSTSLGAEGIDISEDQGLLVADKESDFANKVIALIKDGDRRKRIGLEGSRFVRLRYDNNVIFSNLENTYKELINNDRS